MCMVTVENGVNLSLNKAINSQKSQRFYLLSFVLGRAKRLFVWAEAVGKCSATCALVFREIRTSSEEKEREKRHCVQTFNEKPEVWSLDRTVFFSDFSNWLIILPTWTEYHTAPKTPFFKQIPTALCDQIQVQWKWLVWPSVIHSECVYVLYMCVTAVAFYQNWRPKPRALLAACHKCC